MAELKICPFCGRVPIVEDCGDNRYFVRCKCGIAQDKLYGQRCDAVRRWNTRKPSAQQWIPVSERLPEEYVQVLCYQPKVIADEMWIGYINEKGIWVKGSGWEQYTNPVTAWMPLPEPYKEDE